MPPPARRPREGAFFDVPALGTGLLVSAAADGAPRTAPGFRAICAAIRREIRAGALKPGARLPSTRALAATLGVARMTVVTAYEQLRAEGYVEGRVGSGTRVTTIRLTPLPTPCRPRGGARAGLSAGDSAPGAASPAAGLLAGSRVVPRAADYAALVAQPGGPLAGPGAVPAAFRPGVPALDAFPIRQWAGLTSRAYRAHGCLLLAGGDPRGYRPLREAVAAYLGAGRGVRCDAEQVVIVTGAQQAFHLAARVCLAPGDAAWVEEPGYPSARRALAEAGARVVPVPVDAEGLDVGAGRARAPDARLAFVTPAHQAPLGTVMSAARRLALLAWARAGGAWVLEDDYDGEFRYAGHPVPALQGLTDAADRVLYLGTFTKTLFPAIRLAYLVVPPALVDAVVGARAAADRYSPTVEQVVAAEFLERGWFARHVRRMRALYAERQAALLDAAGRELVGTLRLEADPGGLQLLGWLPPGVDADAACRAARAGGVETLSLNAFYAEPRPGAAQALMLGYAAVDAATMRPAARRLARALAPLVARPARPRPAARDGQVA